MEKPNCYDALKCADCPCRRFYEMIEAACTIAKDGKVTIGREFSDDGYMIGTDSRAIEFNTAKREKEAWDAWRTERDRPRSVEEIRRDLHTPEVRRARAHLLEDKRCR